MVHEEAVRGFPQGPAEPEKRKGVHHFDVKTGVMTVGWFKFADEWYYFKDSGAMAKNEWLQINGKWYYFDRDGVMLSGGTFTFKDSKQYTFDANGAWIK